VEHEDVNCYIGPLQCLGAACLASQRAQPPSAGRHTCLRGEGRGRTTRGGSRKEERAPRERARGREECERGEPPVRRRLGQATRSLACLLSRPTRSAPARARRRGAKPARARRAGHWKANTLPPLSLPVLLSRSPHFSQSARVAVRRPQSVSLISPELTRQTNAPVRPQCYRPLPQPNWSPTCCRLRGPG